MSTRSENVLRALDQQPTAEAYGCGLIYLCEVEDAAAAEVQAATSTEEVDGMLCTRVGAGNSIWPLPSTFDPDHRRRWEVASIRETAVAAIDDPNNPMAIAVRALIRMLKDEIHNLKAGTPNPSRPWAEDCEALRAAIRAGVGDA